MEASDTSTLGAMKLVLWVLVVLGLLMFGVGVFLLVDPHETLKVITKTVGVLLIVDGALAIVTSIVARGEGRALLAIGGVLAMIAGLVLLKKPFNVLNVLVVILGIWLVVSGAARLVYAFTGAASRGLVLLAAAIDLVGGIVILSWPSITLTAIAVILGIVLILRGLLCTFTAWAGLSLLRSERRADAALAV